MSGVLLQLCILTLAPCTVIGFLYAVCGYALRKKITAFCVAAPLCLAADAAILFSVHDVQTQALLTELLQLLQAMLLPYLLLVPKKRQTFAAVALMICSTADFLQCAALSVLDAPTQTQEWIAYVVLYALAAAAVWTLGLRRVLPHVPDFPDRVPGIVCFVLFVSNYSAYYSMTLRRDMQSDPAVAAVLHYGSTVLTVSCISYVIYRYITMIQRQKEREAQHALQLQHYASQMQNDRDLRAFRHDIKNNLFALSSLLENGRYDETRAYIAEMTDALAQTRARYQTGNLLADAILTDKADAAQAAGIEIEFDGVIGNSIADSDLCTILANALDNAIEGCRGCVPCTIRVQSALKASGMILTVQNPVAAPVVIRGGTVQTGKRDKRSHGFGIANIRRAARKYDGYADIACDGQAFTIEIGLIMQGEEET